MEHDYDPENSNSKGGFNPNPKCFAAADACRQLNERLAPFKAKMPGASFKDIVNAAYFERIDLSAHGFYITPDVTGKPPPL